jgi:sugar lactone lactonase YvrE
MTRTISVFALLVCFTPLLSAAEPQVKWEVTQGCDRPESAYFDPITKNFFISQISGEGGVKDGKGWITRCDASGKVLAEKWVEGLNAPKGLRSHKNLLWVSDLDRVVCFEIDSGKQVAAITIPEAKFLNDLATDAEGTVYVSDMIASKIYTVKNGKIAVFAEGEDIESPNGLLVEGDSLVCAGWGYTDDFNPKTPGRLFKLNLKTKEKTLIAKEPTGNLDGVEVDGQGGYIVTDWKAGKVFRISGEGKVTTLLSFEKNGTADIAYLPEQRLLVLPLMLDNVVRAYELPK